MNTDRPCICGCPFEDHAELKFKDPKQTMYYCREHVGRPGSLCITYTPLDNLKWLELKSQNEKGQ